MTCSVVYSTVQYYCSTKKKECRHDDILLDRIKHQFFLGTRSLSRLSCAGIFFPDCSFPEPPGGGQAPFLPNLPDVRVQDEQPALRAPAGARGGTRRRPQATP